MTQTKKFEIQRFAIYGTARADSINTTLDSIFISTGASADTIVASGDDVTVDGGSAADKITVRGDGVRILGGSGNDSIFSSGNGAEIYGDSGADVIFQTGNDSSLFGGSGNDKFSLGGSASDNTIFGGSGNDTIIMGGENNTFVLDGGKNVILGYTAVNAISVSGDYLIDTLTGGDSRISVKGGMTATLKSYTGEINIIGGKNLSTPTVPSALQISNSADSIQIVGTAKADTITNSGNFVTIKAGDGDNIIVNENIRISRGSILHGVGQNVLIETGGGDDTINNAAQNVTIYAGAGADYISNENSRVVINAGDGNNRVVTDGDQVTIEAGANDDYIISSAGDEVLISAGGGNNFIISAGGAKNSISAGNGNDTIYVSNDGKFIQSGGGNDNIFVGKFIISNTPYGTWTLAQSSKNTLDATAGNNIITFAPGSTENIVVIKQNSGNNTIVGGKGNFLSITGTTRYTVEESQGNCIVSLEGGATTTFKETAENQVTITGGTDITERTLNISISASNTLISGSDGNDFIVSNGNNNTILGNDGEDTIRAKNNNLLRGGDGDDFITAADNNTIYGNCGDDTISLTGGGNLIFLEEGAGNDLIIGVGKNDTLQFDEGAELETLASGNNLIFTEIASGDEFTITGALNNKINIRIGEQASVLGGETDEPKLPVDVIKEIMSGFDNATVTSAVVYKGNTTISGGAQILDDVIAASTKWDNFEQAKAALIDSLYSYINSDPENGYEKFALAECGINYRNEDTGSIIGYDAGYSPVELNASDVVRETGKFDETFKGNNFTLNDGLYIYLDKDFSNLSDVEKYLWRGLKSWWLPAALDLIVEGYGENFGFGAKSSSTLTENKMRVVFYNDDDGTLASVSAGTMNSRGETQGPLTLNINLRYYQNIIRGDEDGKSSTSGSILLDRVLAHELNHAVMNAHINFATGAYGLPQFTKDGLAELIHGADDIRRSGIVSLLQDPESLADILDVNKLYRYSNAYPGGFIFWRFVAHQNSSLVNSKDSIDFYSDSAAEQLVGTVKGSVLTVKEQTENPIELAKYASSVTKVNASTLTKSVEIVGRAANESLKGGTDADKIYGGAGKDTLYGGAGADTLVGGSGDDKLYGDAGNDYLAGGLGNDTLTGGNGADIFIYEAGADLITDYTAGTDKIQIGEEISSASLKGSDVVFNFDSGGTLTVKNGKNKKLTVIDAEGSETSQIYGLMSYSADKTVVSLASGFSGTLSAADYASTVKKIDASAISKATKLNGNSQNNTILGSAKVDTIYGGDGADSIFGAAGNDKIFGDAGADTLAGGTGNDTLTGGAGDDVFVYSAGKDVITDYAAGDRIKISSGSISKTTYSGANVVFTVGSGTLTVKNAKGKAIAVTDAADKTKIYGSGVSGTNGNAAPWFVADDTNFIGETNLDAISNQKYSITNFENTSAENFAQTSSLSSALTFAK